MNEYKVTLAHGFDSKTFYVKAESAAEIQEAIERKFGFELDCEGLRIKDISRV